MMNHNQNITTRKFELQAFVDVINTADAYKLSRLSEYERPCLPLCDTKSLFNSRIAPRVTYILLRELERSARRRRTRETE